MEGASGDESRDWGLSGVDDTNERSCRVWVSLGSSDLAAGLKYFDLVTQSFSVNAEYGVRPFYTAHHHSEHSSNVCEI